MLPSWQIYDSHFSNSCLDLRFTSNCIIINNVNLMEDKTMIGERLQRARNAKGLSMRALAETANVSAMAISKYERNLNTPGSDVLLSLSKALDVKIEYFFRQANAQLDNVAYRKQSSLSKSEEQKILSDVQDQLERWIILDDVLPSRKGSEFIIPDSVPHEINSTEDIEQAANAVREAWKLGNNPIPSLIDTFEEQGVRVITTEKMEENNFNGLSASCGNRRVIAIGSQWPGDRQRFTLAHELGHLIVESRLGESFDTQKLIEKACDHFAGAFLLPGDKVVELLGIKRSWLEPRELIQLKHEYGVSMAAWSYRALAKEIIDKSTHGKFWGYLKKRGWHLTEPGEPYPPEQSRIFKIKIYHALAEDLLAESKAAELLGKSLRDIRNWSKDFAHVNHQ